MNNHNSTEFLGYFSLVFIVGMAVGVFSWILDPVLVLWEFVLFIGVTSATLIADHEVRMKSKIALFATYGACVVFLQWFIALL